MRQALASGHIDMDIERFGALTITDKGREVLEGRAAYACKAISTTKAKLRKRAKAKIESTLSARDQDLLLALKAKRMEIARGLAKPAYIVFSDATLMDMAQKRPDNAEAMLEVSGVGAVKFERFGPAFLEVIAAD